MKRIVFCLFSLAIILHLNVGGVSKGKPIYAPQAVCDTVNVEHYRSYYDYYLEYVDDKQEFMGSVCEAAAKLGVPPMDLLIFLYSESHLKSWAQNRSTRATGIGQLLPSTAKENGITVEELKRLSAKDQLPYVVSYFSNIRPRPKNMVELKVIALRPRSAKEMSNPNHVLYSKPSKAYVGNASLDENNDGDITVYEVSLSLKRYYSEH